VNQLGRGDIAGLLAQDVNMILNAADQQSR
jgi:hypothetical protein